MGNEGIENDRLVFDYLSRVGDLAQQRQVPAAERRELVSGLRDEIERRREVRGEAVPGILRALGSPDEVVGRATPEPGPEPEPEPASAPQPSPEPSATPYVPGPRKGEPSRVWWQEDAMNPADPGGMLGFVGGVEIPELLKPPPPEDEKDQEAEKAEKAEKDGAETENGAAEDSGDGEGAEPGRRARFRVLGGLRLGSPLLLLSAALLLAGAALGSLVPLGLGWLLAYFSRERRGAVVVAPGLVVAGGIVWLWGRVAGRWGAPVPTGDAGMGSAIGDTWPWTLRAAAVASALFLLWRARRRGRAG